MPSHLTFVVFDATSVFVMSNGSVMWFIDLSPLAVVYVGPEVDAMDVDEAEDVEMAEVEDVMNVDEKENEDVEMSDE